MSRALPVQVQCWEKAVWSRSRCRSVASDRGLHGAGVLNTNFKLSPIEASQWDNNGRSESSIARRSLVPSTTQQMAFPNHSPRARGTVTGLSMGPGPGAAGEPWRGLLRMGLTASGMAVGGDSDSAREWDSELRRCGPSLPFCWLFLGASGLRKIAQLQMRGSLRVAL